MLAHPSTELVARAPCQLRHSHARPVRPRARASSASSAALRWTSRASATLKRGPPQGALELGGGHAGTDTHTNCHTTLNAVLWWVNS